MNVLSQRTQGEVHFRDKGVEGSQCVMFVQRDENLGVNIQKRKNCFDHHGTTCESYGLYLRR